MATLEFQSIEEKLLSCGIDYAIGADGFQDALSKIRKLLAEYDENCHCCRLPHCECDERD